MTNKVPHNAHSELHGLIDILHAQMVSGMATLNMPDYGEDISSTRPAVLEETVIQLPNDQLVTVDVRCRGEARGESLRSC